MIGDRLAEARRRAAPIETANETISATHSARRRQPATARARGTRQAVETPAVDRVARLAIRQQLSREAGATYLDSLMLSTDSVVRRWPDRSGSPIRVAIVEGGAPGYTPRWRNSSPNRSSGGKHSASVSDFEVVRDTSDADVIVHWIDRFDFDRAGQTDLTWDQAGPCAPRGHLPRAPHQHRSRRSPTMRSSPSPSTKPDMPSACPTRPTRAT